MKKNYYIETDNLIALCHIIDDYKDFEQRLFMTIPSKNSGKFVFQLCDVSKGRFYLGARKAKRFYNENKKIIDTINKYSRISSFLTNNYNSPFRGAFGNLQFFYEYILLHKEKIDNILSVLKKLKELGFTRLVFNEELDFTQEAFTVGPSIDASTPFIFVYKPIIIPNYESYISYKTAGSNYKMELSLRGNKIAYYNREITLNSLLFDPSTLPAKMDYEHTLKQIITLNDKQEEETKVSTIVRNSVNLSIGIKDLEDELKSTNLTVNRLEGVTTKKELLEILKRISEDIDRLKTLSREYDKSVIEESSLLTSEVLENEKTLYLRRRFFASLDID